MRLNKISLACLVLGGSAFLTACGGDVGSALTLNGTAATGAPVNGGAVSATCKTGAGTTTSNADGSYTAVINGGVGPCLLSIKATPDSVPMYSITSGSGATQTANITPMTNLLVSYLRNIPVTGVLNVPANPEDWFALPAAKALLTDTVTLKERITDDFIPALLTLLPPSSLIAANANFLFTAFTASPTASPIDAELVLLKTAISPITGAPIVSSTGVPAAAATTSLATEASNDEVVPPAPAPTGATGAGG